MLQKYSTIQLKVLYKYLNIFFHLNRSEYTCKLTQTNKQTQKHSTAITISSDKLHHHEVIDAETYQNDLQKLSKMFLQKRTDANKNSELKTEAEATTRN